MHRCNKPACAQALSRSTHTCIDIYILYMSVCAKVCVSLNIYIYMYILYIYDIYIYIYIYIRSLICVAFAVFECTTVPYPIYPCMVSMLTLGAGILMVNVTAYRIHWSYGYHYHHATRLQAAQEAIAQGERRKKLVQSVVGVGAGPTSQVLAKRDRSEVLMTPSTQVTPETVKKHCEGHVTPWALSFSGAEGIPGGQ